MTASSDPSPTQPLDKRVEGVRTLAAICIVIASLKLAADLLVPLLLAVFFAMALIPLADKLQKKGLPAAVATGLSFLLGALLIVGLAALVGVALGSVQQKLPEYEVRLSDGLGEARGWLEGKGAKLPEDGLETGVAPEDALQFVSGLVSSLGSALSNAIVILLVMLLLLFERAALTGEVAGTSPRAGEASRLRRVVQSVTDYLSVKTAISLLTGLLFGIACALIGVDFPLLWGLLAFLLNYIPNIGSVLAAIPAVLVALLQLGFDGALLVLVANLLINGILGNVIEPKLMGRKVGLSTLTIFVGLVFWSWVFGPVGTVLSVPLSIATKLLLQKPDAEAEAAPAPTG